MFGERRSRRIVICHPSFLLSQFVSCAFREIVTTTTDDLITRGLLGTHQRYGGILLGACSWLRRFTFTELARNASNVATAALQALPAHETYILAIQNRAKRISQIIGAVCQRSRFGQGNTWPR